MQLAHCDSIETSSSSNTKFGAEALGQTQFRKAETGRPGNLCRLSRKGAQAYTGWMLVPTRLAGWCPINYQWEYSSVSDCHSIRHCEICVHATYGPRWRKHARWPVNRMLGSVRGVNPWSETDCARAVRESGIFIQFELALSEKQILRFIGNVSS